MTNEEMIAQLSGLLTNAGNAQQVAVSPVLLAQMMQNMNKPAAPVNQGPSGPSEREKQLETELANIRNTAEAQAKEALQGQINQIAQNFQNQLNEQKLLNQKEKIVHKLGIDETFEDLVQGASVEEILQKAQAAKERQDLYDQRVSERVKKELEAQYGNQQQQNQNQQNQGNNQQQQGQQNGNQGQQQQNSQGNDGSGQRVTSEMIDALPESLKALVLQAQGVLTDQERAQNAKAQSQSLEGSIGYDKINLLRAQQINHGAASNGPGLGAGPNVDQARQGTPAVDIANLTNMTMKDYAKPETRQHYLGEAQRELQNLFAK